MKNEVNREIKGENFERFKKEIFNVVERYQPIFPQWQVAFAFNIFAFELLLNLSKEITIAKEVLDELTNLSFIHLKATEKKQEKE